MADEQPGQHAPDEGGNEQVAALYGQPTAGPDGGPPGVEPEGGQSGSAGSGNDQVAALYGSNASADPSAEQQVSWLDVPAHAPVVASDGTEVGHVVEVAALPEEDIFHGIVFQHSGHGHPCLAPASDVARITERAVYLSVDSGAASGYGEFQQLHVSTLGLRGVWRWKHLGWKNSSE